MYREFECVYVALPSDGDPEDSGWDPEFEEAVKKEKEELVNESMKKLEEGMQEAQVHSYVSSQLDPPGVNVHS